MRRSDKTISETLFASEDLVFFFCDYPQKPAHRPTTRMSPYAWQRWIVSRLIEEGFDLGRLRQTAGKILLDKRVLKVIE